MVEDFPDVGSAQTVFFGQDFCIRKTDTISSPHFQDLYFGYFRLMVSGASQAMFIRNGVSKTVSAFFHGVLSILLSGPQPQVSGIHTQPVVASRTIVAYLKTLWNRAESYYPRNPMGKFLAVMRVLSIRIIRVTFGASRPEPAVMGTGLIDTFPKALLPVGLAFSVTALATATDAWKIMGWSDLEFSSADGTLGLHGNVFRFGSCATRPAASTAWSHFVLEDSR